MRPQRTVLSAAGACDWIPVNHRSRDFGIGFGCHVSNGATLTYLVEHTFSNMSLEIPVSISRTTTTATITFPSPHYLTTSNNVVITGTRESNFTGTFYPVSIPSATTITITVSDTGAASDSAVITPVVFHPHDTVVAKNGLSDGGYDLPCTAVRARISAYTDGDLIVNWVFQD